MLQRRKYWGSSDFPASQSWMALRIPSGGSGARERTRWGRMRAMASARLVRVVGFIEVD
jgi:hypothetical protein